ncbi:MAG TPA: histidine kinase dimerization/phospho-acceptor domain-containing protein [Actinomycetota bacterium]|nr:histidine kinase dimerization/phospho-acceptor domain-containing protein [Actinomycetota bacterium]
MSERNELLAEIEREFSSRVVHQLKTPLALMHGYAATLLERDLSEEQRRWFLDVIRRQAASLATMLDRLEDLRRLHEAEDGRGSLRAAVSTAAGELAEGGPLELRSRDVPETDVPVPARWLARALVAAATAFPEATDEPRSLEVSLEGEVLALVGSTAPRERSIGFYVAGRILERFGGSLEAEGARVSLRLPT